MAKSSSNVKKLPSIGDDLECSTPCRKPLTTNSTLFNAMLPSVSLLILSSHLTQMALDPAVSRSGGLVPMVGWHLLGFLPSAQHRLSLAPFLRWSTLASRLSSVFSSCYRSSAGARCLSSCWCLLLDPLINLLVFHLHLFLTLEQHLQSLFVGS